VNCAVVNALKNLSPLPIIELRLDSSESLSKLTEHVPSNLHITGTLLEGYFSTRLTRQFFLCLTWQQIQTTRQILLQTHWRL